MIIRYYNLSQCEGDRVVYLRSTDVEQKNYERLLWAVPDEWLYRLYRRDTILIIDISSNGKGKIERIFIPVLVDVLRKVLLGKEPINKHLTAHINLALGTLNSNTLLMTKYKFWRGKINAIDIVARTISVEKEPNPLQSHT